MRWYVVLIDTGNYEENNSRQKKVVVQKHKIVVRKHTFWLIFDIGKPVSISTKEVMILAVFVCLFVGLLATY